MMITEGAPYTARVKRAGNRVTKIGTLIKKYFADKSPQLINVHNRTMSLVGPRHHTVIHNKYCRNKVHSYIARDKMKPDITGWTQFNGCRGEADAIEKMQRRLKYHFKCIQNWFIALNIRILLKTLITILFDKNAYKRRWP